LKGACPDALHVWLAVRLTRGSLSPRACGAEETVSFLLAGGAGKEEVRAQGRARNPGQVLAVAWLTGTVFFLATYASPCRRLPPPGQLQFYEMGGGDQDIFAGVAGTDSRGLQLFPRLGCARARRAASWA